MLTWLWSEISEREREWEEGHRDRGLKEREREVRVREERETEKRAVVVVGWLLNVPATCKCISGTDLLRQFYVLPH